MLQLQYCSGVVKQELSLEMKFTDYPHLWAWAVGSDWKNKVIGMHSFSTVYSLW